ncbi:MAG: ferritin-like domain-containing protein [Mariprofundaceae bacterium]|nr:ferritin-like domain-containing protein [Mariprofundaceae bacterium]
MKKCFFETVRACLLAKDVDEKLRLTRKAAIAWRAGELSLANFTAAVDVHQPGVPDKPELVSAKSVPKRGFGTQEGRAIMIHAIVHIEFNAVNLALDAAQRFSGMPEAYYADWLRVADEEAYHFELIRAHLRFLGAEYGDYPAHRGLWDMVEKTSHDVLERMALVPRVLEARGLDVTPGIQLKLRQAGDEHAATILDIIFRDEIGHVAVGSHWFRVLCKQRGLEAEATFFMLLEKYFPQGMYGPFHEEARLEAGFTADELARLLAGSEHAEQAR